MPSGIDFIAGYPYRPQALRQAPNDTSVADRFHVLLKEGGLAQVKDMIAARPQLLAELMPVVANPEASINVRIGASVVFEAYAGSAALRALRGRLGELSAHPDQRVRADACFFLGLTGDARAGEHLAPRLHDESAEVREIAADALDMLKAS